MAEHLSLVCLLLVAVLLGPLAQAENGTRPKPNNGKLLTKTPEWLRPCRRKDPNLNECMRTMFATMFAALENGIPEIGVARFEPLYIKKIGLSKGQGPVTITGNFHDIQVYGPSNATCTAAKLNMARKTLEMEIDLPVLRVDADYTLRGNILLLPLVGSGSAKIQIRNATAVVSNKLDFPRVDDKEVMQVSHMHVDFTIRDIQMHFTNLFNGNKVLGLTVNNFVNQNHHEILKELKEPLGVSLSETFKDIFNSVFEHLPTEMWLTEEDEDNEGDFDRKKRQEEEAQRKTEGEKQRETEGEKQRQEEAVVTEKTEEKAEKE